MTQETCDYELQLHLFVSDPELSPEEMTAILGLEPDKVSRRGARIQEPPMPKVNVWKLKSPAPSEDSTPADLWDALWQRLKHSKGRFGDLPSGVTRRLVLVVYAHKHLPGLEFAPETLSQIAALGLSLEISTYNWIGVGEEDPAR